MVKTRICFVCLGNICRSPTAEGVFHHLLREQGCADLFQVESAGTDAYHTDEQPDRRSALTARARGIELRGHARRFESSDFDRFDHVVAMDRSNADNLAALARDDDARAKVVLLRAYDPACDGRPGDVPDPYYGGGAGFDEVLDICLRSCAALLEATKPSDHPGRGGHGVQ